jgi:hypothetical protein
VLVALFVTVWLIMFAYGTSFIMEGQFGFDVEIIVISTLLSALAVVNAGLSLFMPYLEKNAIELRYKRALIYAKRSWSQGEKSRN